MRLKPEKRMDSTLFQLLLNNKLLFQKETYTLKRSMIQFSTNLVLTLFHMPRTLILIAAFILIKGIFYLTLEVCLVRK